MKTNTFFFATLCLFATSNFAKECHDFSGTYQFKGECKNASDLYEETAFLIKSQNSKHLNIKQNDSLIVEQASCEEVRMTLKSEHFNNNTFISYNKKIKGRFKVNNKKLSYIKNIVSPLFYSTYNKMFIKPHENGISIYSRKTTSSLFWRPIGIETIKSTCFLRSLN